MASRTHDHDRIIRWIMLAVLVWGTILAVGAALFGVDSSGSVTLSFSPLRGAIVLGCVLAFLGFWRLLLRRRPADHVNVLR